MPSGEIFYENKANVGDGKTKIHQREKDRALMIGFESLNAVLSEARPVPFDLPNYVSQ